MALVVKTAPETFVLIRGRSRYVFRPDPKAGEVRVTFVGPNGKYDRRVPLEEGRSLWNHLLRRGFERW